MARIGSFDSPNNLESNTADSGGDAELPSAEARERLDSPVNNIEDGSETGTPSHDSPTETDKRKLRAPSREAQNYTMNTPATIDNIRNGMDDESKGYFDSKIQAGGGVEGQRAHLRPSGTEYYMTSGSQGKASGNFLTEDHPGDTPEERRENLQLPPENDATDLDKVVSQRPAIVLTSNISPQPEWAEKAGYNARPGMRQTFTPTNNKDGAIEDGIYNYKIEDDHSGDTNRNS